MSDVPLPVSTYNVEIPVNVFVRSDQFQSLFYGKIYVGVVDKDPLLPENQIDVFVEGEDGELTQIPQPLRTNAAGYPVFNGKVVKFVTLQNYSIAVTDSNDALQLYFPKNLDGDPDYLYNLLREQLAASTGASMIGYGDITVAAQLNLFKTEFEKHGVSTSSLGIGHNDIADVTSIDKEKFQEALNDYKYILVDTIIGIDTFVTTGFEGQILFFNADGRLRQVASGDDWGAMLRVQHQRVLLEGIKADNPTMFKPTSGNRQGAVDFQADYGTVNNGYFLNQLNAVTATSTYAAHATRILNSFFIDCLGVAAEDRGDAVTLWGSGSIIANCYASCKEGEDARIAFHFEAPVGTPTNPRPQFDAMANIMVGNVAYGNFRRHFAFEGINVFQSVGNVSLGGATWWCECYIQCRTGTVQNSLLYTRTAAQTQGSTWNPARAAILINNWSDRITIKSAIRMAANSVGRAIVIQARTTSGFHRLKLEGVEAVNLGDSANDFFNILPTFDEIIVTGCRAVGFNRQISFPLQSGCVLKVSDSYFDKGDNTENGSGIVQLTGSGGDVIVQNTTLKMVTGFAGVSLSNAGTAVIMGCGLQGANYAASIAATSNQLMFINNYSLDTAAQRFRYTPNDSGAIESTGDWTIKDNVGILASYWISRTSLQSAASPINTRGKQPGREVTVRNAGDTALIKMYASGSLPTSPWVAYAGTAGETITPA